MKKIIVFLTLISCYAFSKEISVVKFDKTEYGLYEKVEGSFSLGKNYDNPYDPDVVKVDAIITEPNGNTYIMPAFYYVPVVYEEGNTMAVAKELKEKATWMVRFSPKVVGIHKVSIKVKDTKEEYVSNTQNLNVKENSKKGFIRVNKDNKYTLNFDNGAPYYPVGYNIAWNNYWSDGRMTEFYKDYYGQMGKNNQTWTRYWLAGFAKQAVEWNPKDKEWYEGLGKYSQKASGILDKALDYAKDNNLYLQLVLQHHGQYSKSVNPNWDDNPYNVANGGFLDKPERFFTDERAEAQTKKMYRYVVARWGYSQNIMAWELFNEVHFSDGKAKAVDAWHDEMATFIKELDPYKHIVTTSTSEAQLKLMDDNKDLDILQYHVYEANLDTGLVTKIEELKEKISKPIIVGEFGSDINTDDYSKHPDKELDHVRKGAWINLFTEVPHLFWFWDDIYAKKKFDLLKPLADFTKDVNLSQFKMISPKLEGGSTKNLLEFSPTKGWEKSESNKIVIDENGKVTGNDKVSKYLQGQWHKDMGTSIEITHNSSSEGEMIFKISEASASGTKKIKVSYDGTELANYEVNGPMDINVPTKAGKHTVVFENIGQDWVTVNEIQLGGISTPAWKAYGLNKSNMFLGFVYDTRYGQWAAQAEMSPKGIKIAVDNMDNGKYEVVFVNTINGKETKENVEVKNGTLNIVFPEFYKELAVKAELKK